MNRDKLVTILGAALFLSLAGNFFMAGKMLGGSYEHGPDAGQHAEWQKRDEEMRKKLSEPDRKVLKEAMQQHRPQIQALKAAMEDARQKVWDAQNARPFDQAALDAALKNESDRKIEFLRTIRETRDAVSKQLSPEGQAIFSKFGPGARMGNGDGPWRGRGGFGQRRAGGPDGDSRPAEGQNPPSSQP